MTIYTCATCAIEHPDSGLPPEMCEICSDDRQWVPVTGQQWVTREQLAERGYRVLIEELETDLYAVRTEPKLGIGQRGLLLRTEAGNLLFEPPGFVDDAAIARLHELGGVSVIASSHPHLTGSSIQYSHSFNHAPVYVARADEQWILRPDAAITLWEGNVELLPGVVMYQCGGHFAGSSVVHWPSGRWGAGVLLTGDTIGVGGDRKSVHAMRSYVNNIPLPAMVIERILDTLLPLEFDGLYTAFGTLHEGARETVDWSLRRYVSWVNGEMPE